MPHFNIQVSIQKVEHTVTPRTVGIIQGKTDSERHVTKLADVAITAATEKEAFSKAYRLLDALKPHEHSASCHGPAGETQCGEG